MTKSLQTRMSEQTGKNKGNGVHWLLERPSVVTMYNRN